MLLRGATRNNSPMRRFGLASFALVLSPAVNVAQAAILYIGGHHPEVGLVIRRMLAQNAVSIGSDSLVTDEFWSIKRGLTALNQVFYVWKSGKYGEPQ